MASKEVCSLIPLTCLIHVHDIRSQYQAIKDEWCGVPDVFDSPRVLEVRIMAYMRLSIFTNFRQERHRIDVDCRRTDRNQPLFAAPAQISTTDIDDEAAEYHRHHSIISPSTNDIGAQSPSNEHVDCLAGILLTYNFYETELGVSVFEPLPTTFYDYRVSRICSRNVRPLRTYLRGHEWQ
jgi:hypothetical protein